MDERASSWESVGEALHGRGLRWTPQRQAVIVERCRALDAGTTPSTVYRTLDVLEGLGLVRHGHGADGREEFHVLPASRHGHLHCSACGQSWEIDEGRGEAVASALREGDGFELDIGHVTLVGLCRRCADAAGA
jgi:Fur family ferric uptake transcriptional regulator